MTIRYGEFISKIILPVFNGLLLFLGISEVITLGTFDSLLGAAKFLMSSTNEKINTLNKGIAECGRVNFYGLMQNSFHLNTIISGTEQFVRNMVLKAQVSSSLSNGLPVIMLHSQNNQLASEVLQISAGKAAAIVDANSANFSPFYGLNDYEAIDIILDSIPEKYDVKQNGRYYLEAVSDLMQANRIPTSFNNYVTCPHDTILDRVDGLVVAGKITDTVAQSMRSKIMVGQSEYYKIDSFLRGLSRQMGNSLRMKKSNVQPVSLYKTINDKGVLAIDIGPNFNSIYLDFLVEQLKLAAQKGMQYLLVLDSMNLSENKKLKELITSSSNNIRTIVSCNDLLYACGGNQDMFSSVVAMAKQYLIFSHSSAISAGQWSAVLGEYERIDETVANTKDRTEQTYSAAQMYFPEPRQKSRTVTTSKRRDFIIPPERIVSMQNNEFYMRAENFRGIRHGYITN